MGVLKVKTEDGFKPAGSGGSESIPFFDLSEMGLGPIRLDGVWSGVNTLSVTSVTTDTSELRKALSKGAVTFAFLIEYGGASFSCNLTGMALYSEEIGDTYQVPLSFVLESGRPKFVAINVTQTEIVATATILKVSGTYKLTFSGAVEAEYDGSEPVEVVIPEGGSALPTVSAEDDGKILMVKNGEWTAVTLPNAEGASF